MHVEQLLDHRYPNRGESLEKTEVSHSVGAIDEQGAEVAELFG